MSPIVEVLAQNAPPSKAALSLWSEYRKVQQYLAASPTLRALREDVRGLMSPSPRDLVYREHSLALYRYRRSVPPTGERPLLVLPSLVQKPCIMDLLKGESFLEGMLDRGFDVFMLEWGEPNRGQRRLTLQDYLEGYLGRATRRVLEAAGTERLDLVGISLGGLIALLYAALDPGERLGRLVTLVTPVAFHDDGLLSWWTRKDHLPVDKLVDTLGNIPGEFSSTGFPFVVPTAPLAQLQEFERRGDLPALRSLLALDIWISEGVDLPGEVYREVLKHGYQEDCLVRTGGWPLTSKVARLEEISIPVLGLAARHDRVAPVESCSRIESLMGASRVTTKVFDTGHLGLALGKNDSGVRTPEYWDSVADWLG